MTNKAKQIEQITKNYDVLIKLYADQKNNYMVEYWKEKKWRELSELNKS